MAAEYLERAGCAADQSGTELRAPDASAVLRFAGSLALREPAAAIMGAFSAVEHLKGVLGIAAAREFPNDLTLSDEG